MKKFPLLLLAVFAVCSCSYDNYMQIGTISSDDVKLHDNGDYSYSNKMLTISYDFWSSCGKFSFTVSNNSDKDIVLDMTKSNFVNNGYAFDYYRARTYHYSQSASTSVSKSVSKSRFARVTTRTVESGASRGSSVEYRELEYARIPAHAKKTFGEFQLTESAYRQCGLPRDPRRKEDASRSFENGNSPISFRNILTFIAGDEEFVVNNGFYVSEIQNFKEENIIEQTQVKGCNGRTTYDVNKMLSTNRYYVKYTMQEHDTNDDRGPHGGSSSKVAGFRDEFDDIY